MKTQPPQTDLTAANPADGNPPPATAASNSPNLANSPHPAPSNSPPPVPSRLPRAKHWSRGTKWLIAVGVLLVAAGVSVAGWYVLAGRNTVRPDLLLHPVKKEKLQVTIVERGALESAENNEIICNVKARTVGSTTATTIRWVIDDGSTVKKGDKVIELDDSALKDQLDAQRIVMEQAKGDWDIAEEAYRIQLSQNESDIATAVLAIEVKQFQLEEYVQGTYVQSRTDFVGKVTMAQSDQSMWEERAAWSERMSRPGRQYVTTAQAEADHARLLSSKITLKNLEKQLEVLDNLTLKKFKADYQGQHEEAKRALARVKIQAEANRKTKDVDRKVKKLKYEKELDTYKDRESEIAKCILRAPDDGIVVYYSEERNRWGQGKQSFIAQGETVQEGQKLMRIPNLHKMLVNTRVHEAMISRVHGDLDGGSKGTVRGQRATIRVNAFADHRLHGHVKSVATVPSQQDFFASDVKVYQSMVEIDEDLEGLKPGMDAEVTIYVDTNEKPVLAIPLQAVLGSVNMGEKRRCFVATADGPQAREITLGMANETMVEVKDGLAENEEVIVNPLVLLSEKEKREFANQPVRRRQGGQGPGGRGQGGWQGGGAPGGGMPGGGGPGGAMPGGAMPGGGAPGGAMPGGGMQGGPMPGGMPGGGQFKGGPGGRFKGKGRQGGGGPPEGAGAGAGGN